jgi:hypothetical protein
METTLLPGCSVFLAGYSRLTGEDEEGALTALNAIRRELGDPMAKEHRGASS